MKICQNILWVILNDFEEIKLEKINDVTKILKNGILLIKCWRHQNFEIFLFEKFHIIKQITFGKVSQSELY